MTALPPFGLHPRSALVDELVGLDMPASAIRALIGLGVPQDVVLELAGSGDLAIGQVDVSRGPGRADLFQFGGPDRRLILAVWRGEVLVDLVALSSGDANSWALRRGDADILGEDMLAEAQCGLRRELRLYATPMAWLRGGCDGICVLDWNRAALSALRGLGPTVTLVVDPGAKAKLMGLLQFGGLPLVAEARGRTRADGNAPVRRAA